MSYSRNSERIIIDQGADLSDLFRQFSSGKSVFLFHAQWKLSLFFGKTLTSQNKLLILLKKDTFRNKIMEIVEDFEEKSYNNNGKPLKSSRILRVNPMCFIFLSVFCIFLHFSFCSTFSFLHFLHIFIFSFFSFCHFLNFSFFHFINFFFLSCSFFFVFCFSPFFFLFLFFLFLFLYVGGSKSDFLFWRASISLRFLLTFLTTIFRPVSGELLLKPL